MKTTETLPYPSLLNAALKLLPADIPVSYEYPDWVLVLLPDSNELHFGTANQCYGYDVALRLDGTVAGSGETIPLDSSIKQVAAYITRIYQRHSRT